MSKPAEYMNSGAFLPWTAKTIIVAGSSHNALYGNYRKPTNKMVVVVEGMVVLKCSGSS